MIFNRLFLRNAVLAASLASACAPVLAKSACFDLAGSYAGSFTAKKMEGDDNAAAEINGTWSAELGIECKMTVSVTSGLLGVMSGPGEYAPDASGKAFSAKGIRFVLVKLGTGIITMGFDKEKNKQNFSLQARGGKYQGDYRLDQDSLADPVGGAVLQSKENNQQVEVGVLSEAFAAKAFQVLVERTDIPYDYLYNDIWARAEMMTLVLADNLGVVSAKAFVEGKIYLDPKPDVAAADGRSEAGLSYHIAPAVMVKKGKTQVLTVLDPSLFTEPVPYAAWKAKLLAKTKSQITHEYFTNRFALDPSDKNTKLSDYRESDLDDMEAVNQQDLRRLYVMRAMMKRR
ncbi:protein-glutamine glutaminase family protein [Herbaspirillum sp.]|uniref:protein-glutamine glutaminase family protein n=1 Tax=Herbaspirillum sp. TaxID=1890675 RepID=UPI001B1BFCAC|nr:protein-glutamine glutaminase family protein [Herbaspirillum sp.]MBO9537691.1 hypothetical protein [Herbaspirillum sp.]